MADDRRAPGLRLLWVPIVMALIAAGIVSARGCGAPTRPEPDAPARDTGAR
jgi:hypothetical protein